jgi:CBS domain-containing protein
MNVASVLKNKSSRVVTIRPDRPLREAVETLVEHRVGALLVVDAEGQVVGMLSERDVLRESARRFDALGGRSGADIMVRDVIIGLPDDPLDYVVNLMTEKRIRHLPIIDEGKLTGIISIGDVVKAKVAQAEVEIRHLTDYITGRYPG